MPASTASWTAAGDGPRNGPSPPDTHVSTLTPTGDDLILSKRLEGAFSAAFDLRRFPFDQQGLSITLAFNCANEGRTPVDLSIAPARPDGSAFWCVAIFCLHTDTRNEYPDTGPS